MTDLVITLLGSDRPGLVEAVAQIVAELGGNWLESRMARLAGKFAGILRIEAKQSNVEAILSALSNLESFGLTIIAERSPGPLGTSGGRILDMELVGLDRPGIVREISQLFVENGANVEELTTDRSSAPMSGEMLFRAKARVCLPRTADLGTLRRELDRLASDLMVEIRLVETALEAEGIKR